MRHRFPLAVAWAAALAVAAPATSAANEPVIWGVKAERIEYRTAETDILAWDIDAFAGMDELKVVWRSEGEYALGDEVVAALENQLRLQKPVSDFFDAVAGIRVDTPDGSDRVYAILGLHGLAPQWFEIDADLFISENPALRVEAEYEALITNRLILTPSFELDLPLADDHAIGVGALGPKLEVGARLSYDLADRAVAPYVGVHYERMFGETADLARDAGEERDTMFFVIGARLMY